MREEGGRRKRNKPSRTRSFARAKLLVDGIDCLK